MRVYNNKSQALIAAIIIVVVLALFSVVGASLLGTQTGQSATGLSESTQAFYLAHGGLEWYMQQLADDTNWTDQTDPATQSLGAGTFDISLSNIVANSMDITSVGKVRGFDSRDRERWVSATVKKAFPKTRFAVFWENDPGPETSTSFTGTVIEGDIWCRGSAELDSSSSVTNGWLYYADGETVSLPEPPTATPQVVELLFPDTFPDMPVIDTTYYDDLITLWNSLIDDADKNDWGQTGGEVYALDGNKDWTSQTIDDWSDIHTNGYNITGTNFNVSCNSFYLENASVIVEDAEEFTISCRNDFTTQGNAQINANNYTINCSRHFKLEGTSSINSNNFTLNLDDDFDSNSIVNGTVSITGSGYIVCSNIGNVLIHSQIADEGTFTATPLGGNIYFLSGDTMRVNSATQTDQTVTLNPGCFLYSRSYSSVTTDFLAVKNANTTISGSTLLAERRIEITDGADITDDSVLYVDSMLSDVNNLILIMGSGTTVDGAIVSRGINARAIRINSAASVTGLIYQYGGSGESPAGGIEIDGSSTITGSILVRQFYNNSFGPATVTWDLSSLPSPLPNGFEAFEVYVDKDTWDGL
ncbi:hypothetical protein ACFL2Y_04655 [Candidatus Omnitrophota bacterium]